MRSMSLSSSSSTASVPLSLFFFCYKAPKKAGGTHCFGAQWDRVEFTSFLRGSLLRVHWPVWLQGSSLLAYPAGTRGGLTEGQQSLKTGPGVTTVRGEMVSVHHIFPGCTYSLDWNIQGCINQYATDIKPIWPSVYLFTFKRYKCTSYITAGIVAF